MDNQNFRREIILFDESSEIIDDKIDIFCIHGADVLISRYLAGLRGEFRIKCEVYLRHHEIFLKQWDLILYSTLSDLNIKDDNAIYLCC